MDAIGIDVAVLSHTAPALEQLEPKVATAVAKDANDRLSQAIDRHPDRYLGFATLGPRQPEEAVKELERAVKELGFKVGTLTPTSATPIWTTGATGRYWARPRNWACRSTCIRPSP